jgi:hypothetical protein
MTTFMFPSLQEFRDWLESKGDEYVGKTITSCNCPYHNFLQERGLIETNDVVLEKTTTLFPHSDKRILQFDNPDSIQKFIRKLDRQFVDCTEVTGKFCLRLLDSLGLEEK